MTLRAFRYAPRTYFSSVLIDKERQRLLTELKTEVGDEEFSNMSEEDKANRIKDKLESSILTKLEAQKDNIRK